MCAVRVFVVDDHPIFRRGLAAVIHAERAFEWVGEAAGVAEAVSLAPPLEPDLLLVDLDRGGMGTLEALRPLLPRSRFVVLTDQADPAHARRAMNTGALACLPKEVSAQELVTVMHSAARGHRMHAMIVTDVRGANGQGHAPCPDLTQRERELLGLMARGLSNDKICTRLTIAMPTVKFHVTNILGKLHASNRTQAVLTALKHKLVSIE